MTSRARLAIVLCAATQAASCASPPPPSRSHRPAAVDDPAPAPAPGDLPSNVIRIVDDLLADDLRITAVKEINETVLRFDLEREGRTFRAKWKPMGIGGSETQD